MASAVPPEEFSAGHTSTGQWQSFEMRMRQRRIDRLLVRADGALTGGAVEEAREAVEELERLSPEAVGLNALRIRLAQALDRGTAAQEAATPPVPAPPAPLVPKSRPAESRADVVMTPTAATPPVLVVKPPGATPPAVTPPAAKLPAVTSPVAAPPAAKPPVAMPPAGTSPVPTPPAVKPPVAMLPAVKSPAPKPPVIQAPPVAEAPAPPPALPDERPPAPIAELPVIAVAEAATATPAGSALLRRQIEIDVEEAGEESRVEQTAAEPPTAQAKRNRLPQVAAAVLILGTLGWLMAPRVPWLTRGSRASPAPAATAASAPAPEPVSAALPPAAVDVAVTEITPAETPPAAPPPAETEESETGATSALVGQSVPPAQPTTAAAPPDVNLASSPNAAAPSPEPAQPSAATPPDPVPAVSVAPPPTFERVAEPLPEPLPIAPPAAAPAPALAATASTAAPNPAPSVVPDEARILMTLGRYESAYSNLDVNAAGAVWPGLDRRALSRAFEGLSSQRIDLGDCNVRVAGEAAVAECNGTAAWTPKVGGGSHRQARRWQFRLRSEGGGWQIVSANVK